MSTYCAAVLSSAPDSGGQGTGKSRPQASVLLVTERVDGFFLERFDERGELVRDTQHDTLDEAMRQAYCEYGAISEWRFCPEDADPLEYIQALRSP